MRRLLRTTLTVTASELAQTLREPHVLIFSVGFPLLFYPLQLWLIFQVIQIQRGWNEAEPPRIAVEGPAPVWDALAELDPVPAPPDAEAALRANTVDAVVSVQTDGPAWTATVTSVSTRPRSERAAREARSALRDLTDTRLTLLAMEAGLGPDAFLPAPIEETNKSGDDTMLRFLAGIALPLFLVLNMLIAAIYPAVDVVVGERERGTLETTLTSAASRGAIGLGKVLAVLIIVLMACTGNLVGMGLTLGQLYTLAYEGASLPFLPSDLLSLGVSGLSLLSAALLVTSWSVASVMPAQTFKAGQQLAGAVMLVGMSVLPLLADPENMLTPGLAWVPFGNAALTFRSALAGDLHLGAAALGIAWNLALAGLGLGFSAWWLRGEGAEQGGWARLSGLWRRRD